MIQAAARGLLTRDAMVLEEAWAAYIQVHVRAFLQRRRQEDQRCFGLVGWWRRLRSRRPDEPEMVNTWGEPRYSTQNACYASMDAEFTASQTRTVAYDFVATAACVLHSVNFLRRLRAQRPLLPLTLSEGRPRSFSS